MVEKDYHPSPMLFLSGSPLESWYRNRLKKLCWRGTGGSRLAEIFYSEGGCSQWVLGDGAFKIARTEDTVSRVLGRFCF
jgi:hypothetical protein